MTAYHNYLITSLVSAKKAFFMYIFIRSSFVGNNRERGKADLSCKWVRREKASSPPFLPLPFLPFLYFALFRCHVHPYQSRSSAKRDHIVLASLVVFDKKYRDYGFFFFSEYYRVLPNVNVP